MKKNLRVLALMMLVVPLLGELKIYPFNTTFRVSFGTPIFFLFLLLSRNLPIGLAGVSVGVSVVLFRSAVTHIAHPALGFPDVLVQYLPAFFYYVVYAALFILARANRMQHRPLLVGLLSVGIETSSGVVEMVIRHFLLGDQFSLQMLGAVFIIAVVRSFFAMSFVFLIRLREADLRADQQTAQTNHMLLLVSNLYEESIHLKKTLVHAETIARDCYELYRGLKDGDPELERTVAAQRVLTLAGQIHEIKKDNQKIYAGLARMISDENPADYMALERIGHIIIQTNRKYAEHLNKQVYFHQALPESLPPVHIFTMLSIVNNLVSNAVEAIEKQGTVRISAWEDDGWLCVRIADDGVGIPVRNRNLVFEPGYTTKYDSYGNPSTGIGLSYVKDTVEEMGGSIRLAESETKETAFEVRLPVAKLVEAEVPA